MRQLLLEVVEHAESAERRDNRHRVDERSREVGAREVGVEGAGDAGGGEGGGEDNDDDDE